jgi:hypothetical protein
MVVSIIPSVMKWNVKKKSENDINPVGGKNES